MVVCLNSEKRPSSSGQTSRRVHCGRFHDLTQVLALLRGEWLHKFRRGFHVHYFTAEFMLRCLAESKEQGEGIRQDWSSFGFKICQYGKIRENWSRIIIQPSYWANWKIFLLQLWTSKEPRVSILTWCSNICAEKLRPPLYENVYQSKKVA